MPGAAGCQSAENLAPSLNGTNVQMGSSTTVPVTAASPTTASPPPVNQNTSELERECQKYAPYYNAYCSEPQQKANATVATACSKYSRQCGTPNVAPREQVFKKTSEFRLLLKFRWEFFCQFSQNHQKANFY